MADNENEYVLTKEWPGEQERLGLLETTVDELSTTAIRAPAFVAAWGRRPR